MNRHQKRSFTLIVVLVLISLAIVLATITTRDLFNLQQHVNARQQTIQHRLLHQ